MRAGWDIKAFDECVEKRKAPTKLLSSSYQETGMYPIVSQEKELISGYWDNPDDLVIHKKPIVVFGDHTMVVKYIDFDFVVGADGVKILEPKDFLLSKFFFYWVSSVHIKSRGYARHFRYLREASVPIPALPEQQRIVDILDQEFAKIDALKANAKKSLQAAKDLFQATLKKELEPRDGWDAAQLKDIATIRPPKKEINSLPHNLPVSFLPMEDLGIMAYDIVPKQTKTLGELAGSYTYFADGDVLLAKVTPCFENGKQGIARHLTNGIGFGSSEYIIYRPGQKVSADYLYYFLATDEFHNKGKQQMLGACGLKRLSKEIAEQSIIVFPNLEQQSKITKRIRATEGKCHTLQENYQKTRTLCDDLKQALLRKAFNGEL